ncbi:uncharacterized protein C8A04DRAFT_33468, partial [Dichotomopilus funicola]
MSSTETPAAAPENGVVNQPPATSAPLNEGTKTQVQDVLTSEIGISVMLNRLKQSIASAKEFALFLKKRSVLEDEHANSLKKLCKTSQDNMLRGEHRGGTFGRAYEEMMVVHERMADNGIQFAMSLQTMAEDLTELSLVAEKSRKGWKQSGLAAEQRVADLEAAMRKSKSKYDALAEEYDRVRTGDTAGRPGGKMFGFKAHKSGAGYEEDLLRKAQAADQDYQGKVQVAATERSELETKTRPETVQALQDTVRECDSALALQMQKFASFNEKLVLSNGLNISPLRQASDTRSLRESVLAIDNEKDLSEYLSGQHVRLPPRTGPPKYERNALLDASRPAVASSPVTAHNPQQQQALGAVQPPPSGIFQGGSRSSTFSDATAAPPSQGSVGHSYNQSLGSIPVLGGPPQSSSSQHQHERSFSHGSGLNQGNGPTGQQPYRGPNAPHHQSQPSGSRFDGSFNSTTSQGPPQLGALSFQSPQPQQSQQPPYSQASAPETTAPSAAFQQPPNMIVPQSHTPPAGQQMTPPRPVFGITLPQLYERDGLAVPMVVYQCIQAVDLFGLNVEGIYRLSGSVQHVNKLKNLFDTDSSSSNLDFRNPENFFHDVNSVAGLLKQFFRDLPDPLLTRENYLAFVEAA